MPRDLSRPVSRRGPSQGRGIADYGPGRRDPVAEEAAARERARTGETLDELAEAQRAAELAQRLTEISGSSEYFIEGVTAYANEAKIRTLNVSAELIEKHGAVSAGVAEAMACGMRERALTDYALSVTGIAGPTGGSEEKPVGLVYIGFAAENETKSLKIILPGDRHLIRWRASQAALDLLRRKILKSLGTEGAAKAG